MRIIKTCGKDQIISHLAREADITLSHANKIIKRLAIEGFVVLAKRDKRSYTVHLTTKGDKAKGYINGILSLINENEKN